MNNQDKREINEQVIAPHYPLIQSQEDEINLLDIWRILVKKKKLINIVWLVVILAGSAYAVLKPDIYGYSATIQLGSFFVDGKEITVDDVKNAESKIKEIYIPFVLNDYYAKNPDLDKNIKIDVSVPKESKILMLSSKSSEQKGPIYQELINKISANLIDNNNQIIKERKSIVLEQIANAKKRLQLLADSEKELTTRTEKFDTAFKSSPIDNSGTTALVLTELSSQKNQIDRDKFALEALILNKESELKIMQESKLLSAVTRSIEPVGLGAKLIVALSVFLGLIFAVFIALAADSIEKMKKQMFAPD